ncbi:MAG: hypothetical protein AAFX99_04100 [Myxococcota bacterium]
MHCEQHHDLPIAFACLGCISGWCEGCVQPDGSCPSCGEALVHHAIVPPLSAVSITIFLEAALRACRTRFDQAPRSFEGPDAHALKLVQPDWLKSDSDDHLLWWFDNSERIWRTGDVVWGQIVQANGLLFDQQASGDCPAAVVYNAVPDDRVDPTLLGEVADALFKLKGTFPEEAELDPFAESLTDELARPVHMELPSLLGQGHTLAMGTTFITRSHLPIAFLKSNWLPLVLTPEPPRLALPLPARFWPQRLLDLWAHD